MENKATNKNVNIIAAVARNRAIGYQNKLLYWLPNDLRRFKQLTTGHTIIMGRRTFESLPKGALPNRRNIVLSRSIADPAQHTYPRFPGCDCFASLDEALAHCSPTEEIFVIGGASVYEQALPLATRLLLTEIDDVPAVADAFFPPYYDWKIEQREAHQHDDRHAFDYAFTDYVRKTEENEDLFDCGNVENGQLPIDNSVEGHDGLTTSQP